VWLHVPLFLCQEEEEVFLEVEFNDIGVKQWCILSPLFLSAFLDFVMRQSLPELRQWGVK